VANMEAMKLDSAVRVVNLHGTSSGLMRYTSRTTSDSLARPVYRSAPFLSLRGTSDVLLQYLPGTYGYRWQS
jgi:hypothetical protein